MPAGLEGDQSGYIKTLEIETPIYIWTPDGPYRAPNHICRDEMPVRTTLPDVTLEARKRDPGQEILTSGEWYQIRKILEVTDPDTERGMVTGNFERTSTIIDYIHGKRKRGYFDGLLIQLPEIDDEGNMLTDRGILEFDGNGNPRPGSGIIRARYVWEMALPTEPGFVKNMPRKLDDFINTIYGMDGARKSLHNANVSITPEGLINLIRGDLALDAREGGRVDVIGEWGPLFPSGCVAARAASGQDKTKL